MIEQLFRTHKITSAQKLILYTIHLPNPLTSAITHLTSKNTGH